MPDIADMSSPGMFPPEVALIPSDIQRLIETSSKIWFWFRFPDQRFYDNFDQNSLRLIAAVVFRRKKHVIVVWIYHGKNLPSSTCDISIFCQKKKFLSEDNFRLWRFHCLIMSLLQHIFFQTKTVTKISVGKMNVYNMLKHNWQSFSFF